MFDLGALSAKQAVRRGLEAATSERYRSENPEEFERIVGKRLADSPTLASYYGQALAGSRFDDSAEVGRIGAPMLVIHGSEDRYAPPSNARALAEAIPDARLHRGCTYSKEPATWCSSSGRRRSTGRSSGSSARASRV
jgi:pimeloyl-ACP methyl ester carboxylesterase